VERRCGRSRPHHPRTHPRRRRDEPVGPALRPRRDRSLRDPVGDRRGGRPEARRRPRGVGTSPYREAADGRFRGLPGLPPRDGSGAVGALQPRRHGTGHRHVRAGRRAGSGLRSRLRPALARACRDVPHGLSSHGTTAGPGQGGRRPCPRAGPAASGGPAVAGVLPLLGLQGLRRGSRGARGRATLRRERGRGPGGARLHPETSGSLSRGGRIPGDGVRAESARRHARPRGRQHPPRPVAVRDGPEILRPVDLAPAGPDRALHARGPQSPALEGRPRRDSRGARGDAREPRDPTRLVPRLPGAVRGPRPGGRRRARAVPGPDVRDPRPVGAHPPDAGLGPRAAGRRRQRGARLRGCPDHARGDPDQRPPA